MDKTQVAHTASQLEAGPGSRRHSVVSLTANMDGVGRSISRSFSTSSRRLSTPINPNQQEGSSQGLGGTDDEGSVQSLSHQSGLSKRNLP